MSARKIADDMLPIDSLVENPRNPRRHPEEQIQRLMASLTRDGQTRPVLVRRANRMLIAGHGVTQAAKRLTWTEIHVRLLDVDQPTADRIMLADNRFSDLSSQDDQRVADLLREIEGADRLAAGFTDDETEKLIASLTKQELTVREVNEGEARENFWIAINGPLAQQANVLDKIKQLLAEFTDVTVQLGTEEEAIR